MESKTYNKYENEITLSGQVLYYTILNVNSGIKPFFSK